MWSMQREQFIQKRRVWLWKPYLTFQDRESRAGPLPAPPQHPTWPPFMSFMFMAFFMPLPFSFLFFFFLQQHFLQMQKQQVSSRRPATTAMAIRAQGGTAHTQSPSINTLHLTSALITSSGLEL